MKDKGGFSVGSFYRGIKKSIIDFPSIEENNDLKEFLSFNETFAIISFCAGNRIGAQISLEDMSNLLEIHETKLIHLCGILERAGILKVDFDSSNVVIRVIEISNIYSRNAVYSVIRDKKDDYIILYEKFSKSKHFPRITLN